MADNKTPTFKVRIVWQILQTAGLARWSIVFLALFVIASILVAIFEPAIGGVANAAWLMFQVVTTIGLGDFTCTSFAGRAAAIVLSLYSVFYLALITSALVSYCHERMLALRDESVARFVDQLEHLNELSAEELEELSEKVRKLRKKNERSIAS